MKTKLEVCKDSQSKVGPLRVKICSPFTVKNTVKVVLLEWPGSQTAYQCLREEKDYSQEDDGIAGTSRRQGLVLSGRVQPSISLYYCIFNLYVNYRVCSGSSCPGFIHSGWH